MSDTRSEKEKAWIAVSKMRAQLPELRRIAAEELDRPVTISFSSKGSFSKSTGEIFIAPPARLAEDLIHENCDKYTETPGAAHQARTLGHIHIEGEWPSCAACEADATTLITFRHELGHYSFGTHGDATPGMIKYAHEAVAKIIRHAHKNHPDQCIEGVLPSECIAEFEDSFKLHHTDQSRGVRARYDEVRSVIEAGPSGEVSHLINIIDDVRINCHLSKSDPLAYGFMWRLYNQYRTGSNLHMLDKHSEKPGRPIEPRKLTKKQKQAEAIGAAMLAMMALAVIGPEVSLDEMPDGTRKILLKYRGMHKTWRDFESSAAAFTMAVDLWTDWVLSGLIENPHRCTSVFDLSLEDLEKILEAIGQAMAGHEAENSEEFGEAVESSSSEQEAGQTGPARGVSGVIWIDPASPDWSGYSYDKPGPVTPSARINSLIGEMRKIFQVNDRSGKESTRAGRITPSKLARVATGDDRIFHRRRPPAKRSYHVGIALDFSFSMASYARGQRRTCRMDMARQAVADQAALLAAVRVPFEIIGHSGGYELQLALIKDVNEPWNEDTKTRLATLSPSGGNYDGHTMMMHVQRALKSKADSRCIVYYTDGEMPNANFDEELNILHEALALARKNRIHIFAVGMNTDSPKRYGIKTVSYDRPESVSDVVEELANLLKE